MVMQGGGIPPQQNTMHDSAIGWFILCMVFVALFFLFWYYNSETVKSSFRWFRWAEMWAISAVVDEEYTVQWEDVNGTILHIPINGQGGALETTAMFEPEDLDGRTMHMIGTITMAPMQKPFIVMLGMMALWCAVNGPGTQFRRKFNVDSLLTVQAKNFPVIAPFVKFNPAEQKPRPPGSPVPSTLPPFAEALGPEEWIAYNQIPIPDGNLDESATYRSFARQLGGRWKGVMHLPTHKQVLLAAFCLKSVREREEADDILGELARCWSHKKGLKLSRKILVRSKKILRSRSLASVILPQANQHAFQSTAMVRALATAREEGGVMAPAQFVWLRAYDRTLWYPLNNLGRQSFHMEAIGAMAHYRAEKQTGRPIPKPKLDGAVESIVDYMNSNRARPIPQLDYKLSKRKGIKKPKGTGIKKPANAQTGKKVKKKKKA